MTIQNYVCFNINNNLYAIERGARSWNVSVRKT